ncbi:hypothetical protein PVAND_010378 [Polypedilum vanderplanki]|uniref:Golgin-84 n=1 Tax=Polypedilum vanderplanki TaxID=319348 RepID=A0A9J6CGI5_POLVA|nr:hypothetical protein PVAND_010378 [Polypedilum vanderplanki]
MSWITKAESLLNNIDQKAASVLQNQQKNDGCENSQNLPKVQIPSSNKNILVLNKSTANSTLKRPSSKVSDMDYDSFSEKSVSSRHTVVDNQNDEYIYMKDTTQVETFSAEKELASTKIMLSELRIENNELKMEIESLHEQLKTNNNAQKTNELESAYAIIVNEKRDLTLMNQSLENSNANYIKTISELESNIMKLQQKELEMKQNLEYAKKETNDINIELQNYKVRAQNQLQMKEKLIEQLKSGSSQLEDNCSNDDNSSTLQIEIEQLKNDRNHLESELNLLTKRHEETKSFIEKLEHKHRMAEAAAEDKINSLNETIHQFVLKSTQYEDEIRLLKQENENVREEMFKQKTLMTTKLHEKENELKRLKNAYRESHVNTEIENRVQSLTQSLITKQNNLETMTAERNAMKLQYEKLSNQHEELLLQMRHQRPQVINMNINETDDVKSNFLTINPFDSHMSKKVKRAYSNFDQLGIRISRYLNRYPLARLFSVFYVCFLHLFVLVVLLQSTPSQ